MNEQDLSSSPKLPKLPINQLRHEHKAKTGTEDYKRQKSYKTEVNTDTHQDNTNSL